jgi:hypothetical protein
VAHLRLFVEVVLLPHLLQVLVADRRRQLLRRHVLLDVAGLRISEAQAVETLLEGIHRQRRPAQRYHLDAVLDLAQQVRV